MRTLALFSALSILAAACTPATRYTPEVALKEAGTKVFRVTSETVGGHGSAFLTTASSGQRLLVTAAHVCNAFPHDSLVIEVIPGIKAKTAVVAIFVEADLCILSVPPYIHGAGYPWAANSLPEVNSNIYVAGYPGTAPLSVEAGLVLHRESIFLAVPCMGFLECMINPAGYVTSASVRPGNSGGPLIDAKGYVVGVLIAMDLSTTYGLAIDSRLLQTVLRGL